MHALLYMILGIFVSAFLGLFACAGWARLAEPDPPDYVSSGAVFRSVTLFFTAVIGAGAWWLTNIGWLTW